MLTPKTYAAEPLSTYHPEWDTHAYVQCGKALLPNSVQNIIDDVVSYANYLGARRVRTSSATVEYAVGFTCLEHCISRPFAFYTPEELWLASSKQLLASCYAQRGVVVLEVGKPEIVMKVRGRFEPDRDEMVRVCGDFLRLDGSLIDTTTSDKPGYVKFDDIQKASLTARLL